MPYHYQEAKAEITREVGWRDYGGKHYSRYSLAGSRGTIYRIDSVSTENRSLHVVDPFKGNDSR